MQPQSLAPGTSLTVGARALAKHWHRDGSENWWGRGNQGTQAEKNEQALRALLRVLRDVAWSNVHLLPREEGGSLSVFETRAASGHGARWELLADGNYFFRGFLEPQMVDGHTKKWRH